MTKIEELSDAEMREIRNHLIAAVIQTTQSVGADNVPPGVNRLIYDLESPLPSLDFPG